jgi:hypothetical protein
LSTDCTLLRTQPHERPTTLEELIPADIRLRFGITTHTPVALAPRGAEDAVPEEEIPDMNEIIIPETSNYKEMGEFIEKYGIKVDNKITKDSRVDRLKAIKAWGVANGYRITQRAILPTV